MLANIRFWLYRQFTAILEWVSFRSQRVLPLEPPGDETVEFRPYAMAYPDLPLPGLYDPQTFPAGECPRPRLRRIGLTRMGLRVARRICPPRTRPVPDDEAAFLRAVYPHFFRRAWPHPPRTPEGLQVNGDVIAELAVRGPFASYLRRSPSGGYEIDVGWLRPYRVLAGLTEPGGKAVLEVVDGRLRTVSLDVPQACLLSGMNEDLTTFRHNISVHLATLTPVALATINHLPPAHPVRRLLHHCFHTLLVGNREIGQLQLSGPRGFSVRIFSHDHEVLARMATDYLSQFDLWDFEPPTQFERRGTFETPFAYPYRDNILKLWTETRGYVASYLALYFADDAALIGDREVTAWLRNLDGLVVNGIDVPANGPTLDWLTRLCATVIHVSTVEHDYLNNVSWNYSTLGWIVPAVVPQSGERTDRRRAFDLIATLIGTWKPYNMLLTTDVPSLALDEPARRVMQEWIGRLAQIQQGTTDAAVDSRLSYPANLNPSVSN